MDQRIGGRRGLLQRAAPGDVARVAGEGADVEQSRSDGEEAECGGPERKEPVAVGPKLAPPVPKVTRAIKVIRVTRVIRATPVQLDLAVCPDRSLIRCSLR